MITGQLRLFAESDLDRLHEGVLRVLAGTGLRVCDDTFLRAAASLGAQVDEWHQVVRFPMAVVQHFVDERRQRMEQADVTPPSNGGGGYSPPLTSVIAPFVHDYERGARRRATREDLIEIVHWAEVDTSPERHVGLPVTMGDVDPRLEPIEAYALLLEHSERPDRAYATEATQIPYLLDLSCIFYGQSVFPRGVDFMTSPLTFGDRLARYTLEAIRFGVKDFDLGVMPVSGANAPFTIAGNVVVSAAELLGGWLIIKALVPDGVFRGAACNGIVDMRRGIATFNAPEALLADLGVVELFARRYGGGVTVAAGADYIDARLPGIQAAYERTLRAMAIAAFTGGPFWMGGSGTLDEGKLFSPVQFILERELGEGMWRLGQGIAVDDDSLAVEVISEIGPGEGRSFLDTEHTLRYCREMWFPQLLTRGMWEGDEIEFRRDEWMLAQAYQQYRGAVARYTSPALPHDKRLEIYRIVERARRALLG